MPNTFTSLHEERLSRVPQEHARMLSEGAGSISLTGFFDGNGFDIESYCSGFVPNPHAAEAEQEVHAFMARFDLAVEGGCYGTVVNSAAHMYPATSLERLAGIGKVLAVGFAINDMMGRDKFHRLAGDQQRSCAEVVSRISTAGPHTRPGPHRSEQANVSALAEIAGRAPGDWFARFLGSWQEQVLLTHRDRNARALGVIPTVREYLRERMITGGMGYCADLVEFANGDFLDLAAIEAAGLRLPLRRMRELTGSIACAANDAFSFERECVDNGGDNNLVLVQLLNDPALTLREAISASATTTRGLLDDFFRLDRWLRAALDERGMAGTGTARGVSGVIRGMHDHLKTSWLWQLADTGRYLRRRSVFRELGR